MNQNSFTQSSRLPIWVLASAFIVMLFCAFFSGKKDTSAIYIVVGVVALLALTQLKLQLNKEAFSYQMFPFHFTPKKIEWSAIENVQIVRIDALSDFMGWGYRYSFKYGWGYIFSSGDALFIKLHSGKKRTFTITNKEEIIHFFTDNAIPFKL